MSEGRRGEEGEERKMRGEFKGTEISVSVSNNE